MLFFVCLGHFVSFTHNSAANYVVQMIVEFDPQIERRLLVAEELQNDLNLLCSDKYSVHVIKVCVCVVRKRKREKKKKKKKIRKEKKKKDREKKEIKKKKKE
jgi:hypothetical protein